MVAHRTFAVAFMSFVSLVVMLSNVVAQSGSGTTQGGTPAGAMPGAPAGSYSITDIESINIYSGLPTISIPMVRTGGRGTAGITIPLNISNRTWTVETRFNPESDLGAVGPHFDHFTTHGWAFSNHPSELTYLPAYFPGLVKARRAGSDPGDPVSCPYYSITNTRLTFITADGTEHELIDQIYNGAPQFSSCSLIGPSRGNVFRSWDGSSITFIADPSGNLLYDVTDTNWQLNTRPYSTVSGYLMLKDGTQYRIDNSLISWIRDRNGNKVTFTYSTLANGEVRLIRITDPLNRHVDFAYNINAGFPYGVCDVITYARAQGAQRTIRISKTVMGNAMHNDTIATIFTEGHKTAITNYNPTVVSALWLPNNQSYKFKYNRYEELARVELPIGGAIEYDYAAGKVGGAASGLVGDYNDPYKPAQFVRVGVYRRLIQRRVLADGYTITSKTIYSIPTVTGGCGVGSESCQSVVVKNVDPTQAGEPMLSGSKHYFYGDPVRSILDQFPIILGNWFEGKEHRTDALDTNEAALNITEHDWEQPSLPSGARIIETRRTLVDSNQVAKQTFSYDSYNNITDVYEHDFGVGAPGPLIRRTHISYLTTNPFQDDVDYSTDTSIHIRNLPTLVSIYDGANTEISRIQYEYDDYSSYSLQDCPSIVQHDAGYHTSYGRRGNLTKVIQFAAINPQPQNIYLHNQYDIAGNLVKAVDGRGFATDYDFSDSFGSPDDDARSNSGAPELASGFSYAFPTKVTNALGHTLYTQYDYYLGKPVNSEDANGVVSSVAYDDDLDRPTQSIQARYIVGSGVPAQRTQRTFSYDATNRVIMTRSDRDTFNDNILTAKYYYDGLGRTRRGAALEGSTWIITNTQFDALGRVSQASNPYRAADPDSASPPANLWTTTEYDALSRVIKATTPDGAHVDTDYNGNQVTVTDQAGKKRRSETDALGRLVKVTEDPDGMNYVTTYLYDSLDNLRFVNQGGQGRWFSYDSLSRPIRVRNPEQESNNNLPPHTDPLTGGNGWSTAYSYDANGNLVSKTDARNITTIYTYDALNRNTSVDYSNTTAINPDITRFYDNTNPGTYGKGRYWHDYAGGNWGADPNIDHSAIDSYDPLGRPLTKRQLFKHNGVVTGYSISQSYDLAGNVKTVNYPSGRRVDYGYDQAGRLNSFTGNLGDGQTRTYSAIAQYHPGGMIERESFGAQTPLYLKLLYNKRQQLVDLRMGSVDDAGNMDRGGLQFYYGLNGAAIQNPLVDEPNNNGNLVRQWSYVPKPGGGTVTTQLDDYSYDSLNRLATFTEGQINENGTFTPNVVTQNFAYDRWGNRRVTSANGGVSSYNPTYDTTFHSNRIVGLGYDAAGNITSDPLTGGTMTYDADNLLLTATSGGGGSYAYDAEGKRVRRTTAGQQWWYVYGVGGELVAEYLAGAAPSAVKKEYGYRGGQLLITADSGSTTNLALGKTATQSSTDWGGVAGRGVDGNTSGNWGNNSVTHTVVEYRPWWQVDLGSAQQIGAIKVWNRTDCCGERLSNFFVLVSDAPFTSTDLTATMNQAGVSSYYVAGPVATATEVSVYRSGRYVRVQLAGTNVLSVAEVEVRGGTGIQWLVTDHLGSTRMVIDQTGSLSGIKRHDYAPFGEELTAGIRSSGGYGYVGSNLRQKFTSKERDNETGQDYFMARFYSSISGRFSGVDPYDPVLLGGNVSLYAAQPQNWNRYSYVYNNPLKFIDPNGQVGILASAGVGFLLGGVGAGLFEIGVQLYKNGGDINSLNWTRIGARALNGAIYGAVVGATANPAVAQAVAGAAVAAAGFGVSGTTVTAAATVGAGVAAGVGGVLGGATERYVLGQDVINTQDVTVDFLAGGVAGGAGFAAYQAFYGSSAHQVLALTTELQIGINSTWRQFGMATPLVNVGLRKAGEVAIPASVAFSVRTPLRGGLNYVGDRVDDAWNRLFTELQYRKWQAVDCSILRNRCTTDLNITTIDTDR